MKVMDDDGNISKSSSMATKNNDPDDASTVEDSKPVLLESTRGDGGILSMIFAMSGNESVSLSQIELSQKSQADMLSQNTLMNIMRSTLDDGPDVKQNMAPPPAREEPPLGAVAPTQLPPMHSMMTFPPQMNFDDSMQVGATLLQTFYNQSFNQLAQHPIQAALYPIAQMLPENFVTNMPSSNNFVNHIGNNMPSPGGYSVQPSVTPGSNSSHSPELGAMAPGSMLVQQAHAPAKGDIPVIAQFEGEYGFNVELSSAKENSTKKSMPYAYSESLNKYYVEPNQPCPIKFKCTGQTKPPAGSIVRAMLIYSRPNDLAEIVRRCQNHSASDTEAHSQHVLRAHLQACDYIVDAATGRHSIMSVWTNPPIGSDCNVMYYKFGCYTSCSGGINRRPMQMVFTLEYNGIVLGRQTVALRICACPGRDRKEEEDKKEGTHQKKRQQRPSNSTNSPSVKKSRAGTDQESNGTSTSHQPSAVVQQLEPVLINNAPAVLEQRAMGNHNGQEGDDNQEYFLPIRGTRMYNYISGIYNLSKGMGIGGPQQTGPSSGQ